MSRLDRFTAFGGCLTVTLLAAGCRDALAPEHRTGGPNVPMFATGDAGTAMRGVGAIGDNLAVAFMDRQEFDFNVNAAPGGRLVVRDYSNVRANGSVSSLTVNQATDPATTIQSFAQTSARCVTFGGIGRVDTGDLVNFSVDACDNGSPGSGVDVIRFVVPSIGYDKSGPLTEGEITLSGATRGDLDVRTVTTGSDLDPDGYTVTVNGGMSKTVGTNTTVSYKALTAGNYSVALSGVAGNCTLSGANPRTVTVTAGQVVTTRFDVNCAPTTQRIRATGHGVIGNGLPLPKMDRFELDFDVTSTPGGRIVVTDYSIMRADGAPARMIADAAADPATSVTSFSRISPTCVRFGGVGRLNDNDRLYDFTVEACDKANPGAGADTFSITLPNRPYSKSGTLTQGDIAISTF